MLSAGSSFSSTASGNGTPRSVPIRKSRLRRQPKRPVPTHIIPLQKNAVVVGFSALCCLICFTVVPVYILESMQDPEHHPRAVQGVHRLMHAASSVLANHHLSNNSNKNANNNVINTTPKKTKASGSNGGNQNAHSLAKPESDLRRNNNNNEGKPKAANNKNKNQQVKKKAKPLNKGPPSIVEQQAKPQYTLQDLQQFQQQQREKQAIQSEQDRPVSRGLSGRSLDQTPALVGAKRAHIDNCELDVDSLAYWNDPVGTWDLEFETPFARMSSQKNGNNNNNNIIDDNPRGYITFSPDSGGWNNVRMSMEILFVLAAATGRTLVLPPKEPLYLLNKDKGVKHRGFADFFPLDAPHFPVKWMTMHDFLQTRAQQTLLNDESQFTAQQRQAIFNAANACDKRKASDAFCGPVYDYLAKVGHNPEFSAVQTCLIFDEAASQGMEPSEAAKQLVKTYCGLREPVYWNNQELGKHDHLHLPTQNKSYRLLTHFYNLIYFSDPAISHYFKRFVRDYLHYNDAILCAAGKIVAAVQAEGVQERGFDLDTEGGGGYSAMHIRRGDLQYKRVKIPAKEWLDNTKEVWQDKELLYIATDERNKTFFDDLATHYELRFLDDYWDLAGLGNLDPNFMGMIDTIVASRGRAFAGTWFSTFSGYINRLRGYHGMSMKDSWYSFLPKKTAVHQWDVVTHYAYAFEWPDGWMGIDADVWPERDKF